MIDLHHSDCIEWLRAYDGPLFDSAVTDPPYHLSSMSRARPDIAAKGAGRDGLNSPYASRQAKAGFMGKEWDGGDVAFRPETWRAVYDALKPGAHLVAFSGTRTYHRMACAIEDAGFEIRDCLMWCYGSGFPKSHDVSKGIDRAAGAEREVVGSKLGRPGMAKDGSNQRNANAAWGGDVTAILSSDITAPATPDAAKWQGWGTALKPALEPICLARKPLSEKSVAANVLRWGTGAINVDGCRVETDWKTDPTKRGWQGRNLSNEGGAVCFVDHDKHLSQPNALGRWPANLIHDGSDEVLAGFPETASGAIREGSPYNHNGCVTMGAATGTKAGFTANDGSAARFFYSAKAGPLDRIGTSHATVKPVDVMRWLCRLVTPPGGRILEPFAGSGTTGIAAMAEGFDCTMIELMAEHVTDIERKLAYLRGEGAMSFREHDRRRDEPQASAGPLFGEVAA